MRAIIIILALFAAMSAQAQTKKMQEQFGMWRIHEVQTFSMDTTYDEGGKMSVNPTANMIILREGIDGSYKKVVAKDVYGNVNKTIDWLAKEPEYKEYIIIQK